MSIDNAIIASAKKEYSDFNKEISTEVEDKMRHYLGGFTQYLEKNAFSKKEE